MSWEIVLVSDMLMVSSDPGKFPHKQRGKLSK